MNTTVFLWEPATLDVFDSFEAARRYVEPIDVCNEEYTAFDWDGRRLELGVRKDANGADEVFIRVAQPVVIDRKALSGILAAAILARGRRADLNDFDALREEARRLFLQT